MERLGIDLASFAPAAAGLADEGKSPIYAAVDGQLAGMLAVADPVKQSSAEAIAALHAMGLRVAMVTGDNERTANAVARLLGIDDVLAEVLPDGKAEAVRESTMRRRWPRPTWASRSARAPMSRSSQPTSFLCAETSLG
jgi:P-type E1-E2 ATPase